MGVGHMKVLQICHGNKQQYRADSQLIITLIELGELLGISHRDHITNEEVKARIGKAIGPYEDLLTSVKRRKLKWYGHVTRSSGLAKTILQGTVQGGRRRGRQRKRWEDNIKEWTGLEWNIILRKAENREGVEEAGCKIYSGAPTVSQTTG